MIKKVGNSSGRKGFTLIELLAVIVILAVILVIAVPKVMDTIKDAKKATFESTVKMIASSAEKTKIQNAILGKTETITCESVAKLNDVDYAECSIEFVDNTAKVTIVGSGKFDGLYVCNGDKTSATAQNKKCSYICESNEVSVVEPGYEIVDYNKCVSYLEDFGWNDGYLKNVCQNEVLESRSFNEYISILIDGYYTKEELISNNVVSSKSIFEPNITLGTPSSCVNYTKDVVINEWGWDEQELTETCSNVDDLQWFINDLLWEKTFTKEELLKNNVIGEDSIFTDIKPGNQSSCVSYTKGTYVDQWHRPESELRTLCSGENVIYERGIDVIKDLVGTYLTEQELIENKVIKIINEKKCLPTTAESCFNYEEEVVYEIKNYDSCVSYLRPLFIEEYEMEEEELEGICRGDGFLYYTSSEFLQNQVRGYYLTEQELIDNNVINVNKNITSMRYNPYCEKNIVIPNKINGIPLKKIDHHMATNCGLNESNVKCWWYSSGVNLTSVVIQEGIEEIENFAFYNNNIKKVIFPSSITKIGEYAFYTNQISGELDLSKLSKLKTIGDGVFMYNEITSVKFPTSLETIDGFNNNQISGELDLSNLTNLKTIVSGAFGNNQITSVKLPTSLETIDGFNNNQISGELDLSNLTNLKTIDLFAFENNQITSVKLPKSITELLPGAFEINASSNPNLKTIINPSGRSFDWSSITSQGTSDTCTFVTGTCGSVTIKAS